MVILPHTYLTLTHYAHRGHYKALIPKHQKSNIIILPFSITPTILLDFQRQALWLAQP